jgi:hypothetical protein
MVFRITGTDTNFVRGRTAVSFDPPYVRVLGRPWVIDAEQLVAVSLVQRGAPSEFCEVTVMIEEEEYTLEEGLLIE